MHRTTNLFSEDSNKHAITDVPNSYHEGEDRIDDMKGIIENGCRHLLESLAEKRNSRRLYI